MERQHYRQWLNLLCLPRPQHHSMVSINVLYIALLLLQKSVFTMQSFPLGLGSLFWLLIQCCRLLPGLTMNPETHGSWNPSSTCFLSSRVTQPGLCPRQLHTVRNLTRLSIIQFYCLPAITAGKCPRPRGPGPAPTSVLSLCNLLHFFLHSTPTSFSCWSPWGVILLDLHQTTIHKIQKSLILIKFLMSSLICTQMNLSKLIFYPSGKSVYTQHGSPLCLYSRAILLWKIKILPCFETHLKWHTLSLNLSLWPPKRKNSTFCLTNITSEWCYIFSICYSTQNNLSFKIEKILNLY